MKKRGYEFSFAWLFSIFIGAAVLFFAIYFATQLTGTKRTESETFAGKEIGILLNPIETNLEEAKANVLTVRDETRIYNDCSLRGSFGLQDLSVSIRSGIGQEWLPSPGGRSSFKNKYIFSNGVVEGNSNFFLLSKPFNFPFKVADLIVLWGDKDVFCFVRPFDDVEEEINSLGLVGKGVIFSGGVDECPVGSKVVCFPGASGGCDIEIESGLNKKIYYLDGESEKSVSYTESLGDDKYALLYAAIFSSPEVYECQIERLMRRTALLAELYLDKSQFLEPKGCGSVLVAFDLNRLSARTDSVSSLKSSLFSQTDILDVVENLEDKNDDLVSQCKLF